MVYAGASQWTEAEQEFRAEQKLQPGKAEAAFRLGDALLRQGKAHVARAELERSNRLLPGMPVLGIEPDGQLAAQAHFGLATLYRKQGNAALAAQEMQAFERLQNAMPPSAEEPSPPPK